MRPDQPSDVHPTILIRQNRIDLTSGRLYEYVGYWVAAREIYILSMTSHLSNIQGLRDHRMIHIGYKMTNWELPVGYMFDFL